MYIKLTLITQVLFLEAAMDPSQVLACLLQLMHAVKLMSTAPYPSFQLLYVPTYYSRYYPLERVGALDPRLLNSTASVILIASNTRPWVHKPINTVPLSKGRYGFT